MNSALQRRFPGRAGGFTLLEMVFVLVLLAALLAWGAVNVATVDTEQELRQAAGAIESLAKRARNIAVKQQRSYELTIGGEFIAIAPEVASGTDTSDLTWHEGDRDEFSGERFADVTASEAMNSKISYEIKRWGSDNWIMLGAANKEVVTLDPSGLVEPLSIRCSMGKSWLVQEWHPLTAGVRNEEMNIEAE